MPDTAPKPKPAVKRTLVRAYPHDARGCLPLLPLVGNALPPHFKTIGRYYTTLPDLMGYAQLLCIIFYPLMHFWNYPVAVAALHATKELIDCADGMVARRIGQCTHFGALLDLSTDTVAEYALITCIALASYQSNTIPSIFTGLGFTAFLVFWMWWQTVDVAISFYFLGKGRSWKKVKYDCPITCWYYKNEWTHNFLFLGWHAFYAAFYLQAAGVTWLSAPLLCITTPLAALRFRCMFVIWKQQYADLYHLNVEEALRIVREPLPAVRQVERAEVSMHSAAPLMGSPAA